MTAELRSIQAEPAQTGRSAALARAFRAVLEALARPGRPAATPLRGLEPAETLAPLSPAAAAALLTLADADARYWLAPSRATGEIERALRFAVGDGPAAAPGEAAFCVGAWPELAELAAPSARIGEPEHPDRSTTLIVEVDGFEGGAAARLSGPGVDGSETIAPMGVDSGFWRLIERNELLFPLGIDVLLACGDRLVGLPRSARVEML